jgi:hypothetical protein
MNNHGNASLEAAISLPVVFFAVLILFLGFYGLYLQTNFQHQTYEYLLCAEFGDEARCQQQLQKTLDKALPFGHWHVMARTPSATRRQVQVDFSLAIKGVPSWTWQYQNQINRDLSLSSF